MTAAPLVKAEDIAWFLASYAKDGLATLNEKDASSLKPLRDALETALGLKFVGEEGDHFFKSTLIQTLFYGVFAAWVVHAKKETSVFDWKAAGYLLTVPMVKALFEQIATPSKLGTLGLIPILDRTAQALHRVVKKDFFKTFDTGEAVQHFYEPFLQAYDPVLRKKLGVWFTPPEIVKFMVERVDRVLRTELGKINGLADKDVFILDPCCGTGTYIVAVLRKIEETLREQGADALLGDDIKQAAMHRIFGFELLSAPFVTAHWRVGNYLSELDAPFDSTKAERAGIYLTNSLTGWQPPTGPKAGLPLFPELADERDAAEHVKRDVPILVILGNPPYDGFAGTSPAEEDDLVKPYKADLATKWGIKKFNLDDLYIRFFRLAERRINQLGRGIVAYISNYSFVSEPSYVVMRESLLQTFDKFWIENMHGDRNKSEYASDGRTSETIFAMRGFSPGIRQGVVTTIAVRTGKANEQKLVRYRDDIDAAKAGERRAQLLETLNDAAFESRYEVVDPEPFNKFSFRPRKVTADFRSWPSLEELALVRPENGLMEKRGGALIDLDRERLQDRMKHYFNPAVSWTDLVAEGNGLAKTAARFDPEKTRKRVLHDEGFRPEQIVRYFVRPFDFRYCYYSGTRPLWNEPRPQLWQLSKIKDNSFLVSRPAKATLTEGVPFYFLTELGDNDAIRGHSYYFPMKVSIDHGKLLGATEVPNLSTAVRGYLKEIGFTKIDDNSEKYSSPWWHALAIGFSNSYREEHQQGLAIGWPRIPMPKQRSIFDCSAALGRRLADLLNPQNAVATVTTGGVLDHYKMFGVLSSTDLTVKASWGHLDTKGRVNPGQGRVKERSYAAAEMLSLAKGFDAIGISQERAFALLGPPVDVYLNDTTCWKCVPTAVWEFIIGGYPVMKKWLSYREQSIMGRSLSKEEAREVTGMVRRIAAIVLMTDELNANYAAARDDCIAWTNAP